VVSNAIGCCQELAADIATTRDATDAVPDTTRDVFTTACTTVPIPCDVSSTAKTELGQCSGGDKMILKMFQFKGIT
jgi:hypothetical protein